MAQDLLEAQEEVKEEGIGYVVMKNLFSKEEDFRMRVEKKSRKVAIRESAERVSLSKKVSLDHHFDLMLVSKLLLFSFHNAVSKLFNLLLPCNLNYANISNLCKYMWVCLLANRIKISDDSNMKCRKADETL